MALHRDIYYWTALPHRFGEAGEVNLLLNTGFDLPRALFLRQRDIVDRRSPLLRGRIELFALCMTAYNWVLFPCAKRWNIPPLTFVSDLFGIKNDPAGV